MTWHARLQTTDTCRNRGTNNRCLNSLQHRSHRIPTPHPPSYPSSAAPGFKTFPPVLDWTDAKTERQAARLHTLTDEMSDLQADFHYVLLPTINTELPLDCWDYRYAVPATKKYSGTNPQSTGTVFLLKSLFFSQCFSACVGATDI